MLWSAVFITISTLYRPVEQLLSRHISEHLVKGEPIGGTMRNRGHDPARPGAALRGPGARPPRAAPGRPARRQRNALLGLLLRRPLLRRQLLRPRLSSPGSSGFGLFTALILSESCFRTLFAVLVAVSLLSGQSWVAIGIVAAPSLSLMVVPLAFARRARTAPEPPRDAGGDSSVSVAHGTGFAAAVLVIMFSEQAFLNAGPLIVRSLAGRRRRGLHLQRADAGAGAAAALPGRLDQHPPPPHRPPHQHRARQRGRVPPLGADGPARHRRLHRRRWRWRS